GLKLFPDAAILIALRDGDTLRAGAVAEADAERAKRLLSRWPIPLTRQYNHAIAILDRRVIDIPDARAGGGRFYAPRPWQTHRGPGPTAPADNILLNSRVHGRRHADRVRRLPAGQLPTCRDLCEEGACGGQAGRPSGRTANADRVVDQYANREGAGYCYSECL